MLPPLNNDAWVCKMYNGLSFTVLAALNYILSTLYLEVGYWNTSFPLISTTHLVEFI